MAVQVADPARDLDPGQRWVWHTRPRLIIPIWEHAARTSASCEERRCSLRFIPYGPILLPTGVVTSAGHSNDRLPNTMRMLAGAGLLSATSAGYIVNKALAA